ncbi:MAG: HPr family phosphocarrier protein [Hyphomicrobiales bacterium]
MTDTSEANSNVTRKTLTICNSRGLHARASAKFVKCAESFDAEVTVSKDGHTVPGTSIMGLMMLAATPGCRIHLECSGPQALEVLSALEDLVARRFGEDS